MEEQRQQILKGNLRSLLFKFSTPAIIGMLVSALYNVIDTLFVGQGVGALAIAALTIVMPIQLLMMAVGIMIGIGSASVISRALGANQDQRALKAFGTSIMTNLAISVFFMILAYIFIDRLLVFFGASADTLPYAKDYMTIVLIGFISFSFVISSNNLIRAEGKPRAAMYSMVIGAVANIILDAVFIFVLKMGVRGVAIATIISQLLSAVYIISFFSSSKSIYKFKREVFKYRWYLAKETIFVGFPSFLLQVIGGVIFLIFNRVLLHYGGDIYIAIMGIGLRMLSLIQMPVIGISQGFSTLVSFNYGAQQYARVKKILKEAFLWTLVFAGIGFVAMMGFPGRLISIFSSDPELISKGVLPLRIVVMFLPVIGFQVLGGSLFQAIGKTVPALIIILSRQLLLLIPALIILPWFFGLMGVWFAVPLSDFISVLITSGFVFWQIKVFDRKELAGSAT